MAVLETWTKGLVSKMDEDEGRERFARVSRVDLATATLFCAVIHY